MPGLALVILAACPLSLEARIGETLGTLVQRYGQPYESGNGKRRAFYRFHAEGFDLEATTYIVADPETAVIESQTYYSFKPLVDGKAPAAITSGILKAEAPGYTWRDAKPEQGESEAFRTEEKDGAWFRASIELQISSAPKRTTFAVSVTRRTAYVAPLTDAIVKDYEKLMGKVAAYQKECDAKASRSDSCTKRRRELSGELARFVSVANDERNLLDNMMASEIPTESFADRNRRLGADVRVALHHIKCLGRLKDEQCQSEAAAIEADKPEPTHASATSTGSASPTPAASATISSGFVDIRARVRFTGTEIVVANADPFAWDNVKLEINSGWIRGGYILTVRRIAAGATFTAPLLQFAKSSGERFNPFSMKPQSFNISADTERGEAFWTGGWGE